MLWIIISFQLKKITLLGILQIQAVHQAIQLLNVKYLPAI